MTNIESHQESSGMTGEKDSSKNQEHEYGYHGAKNIESMEGFGTVSETQTSFISGSPAVFSSLKNSRPETERCYIEMVNKGVMTEEKREKCEGVDGITPPHPETALVKRVTTADKMTETDQLEERGKVEVVEVVEEGKVDRKGEMHIERDIERDTERATDRDTEIVPVPPATDPVGNINIIPDVDNEEILVSSVEISKASTPTQYNTKIRGKVLTKAALLHQESERKRKARIFMKNALKDAESTTTQGLYKKDTLQEEIDRAKRNRLSRSPNGEDSDPGSLSISARGEGEGSGANLVENHFNTMSDKISTSLQHALKQYKAKRLRKTANFMNFPAFQEGTNPQNPNLHQGEVNIAEYAELLEHMQILIQQVVEERKLIITQVVEDKDEQIYRDRPLPVLINAPLSEEVKDSCNVAVQTEEFDLFFLQDMGIEIAEIYKYYSTPNIIKKIKIDKSIYIYIYSIYIADWSINVEELSYEVMNKEHTDAMHQLHDIEERTERRLAEQGQNELAKQQLIATGKYNAKGQHYRRNTGLSKGGGSLGLADSIGEKGKKNLPREEGTSELDDGGKEVFRERTMTMDLGIEEEGEEKEEKEADINNNEEEGVEEEEKKKGGIGKDSDEPLFIGISKTEDAAKLLYQQRVQEIVFIYIYIYLIYMHMYRWNKKECKQNEEERTSCINH